MNDILIFISVMAVILLILFGIIIKKAGSLKDYIRKVENKTPLQAALGIMGAMLFAAFIVFMLGQVIKAVKAEEGKWFDRGSVFIGIDYHNNGSVFCRSNGISDELNSNLGMNIEVYRYGDHSFSGNYTHHSCALNPDVNTYDAAGFKYEWKIF